MQGQVNAIVVACAGLNRLGLGDKISFCFDPRQFIPAPAQGALAVQIRVEDTELAELISQIDDKNSRIAVEAERHVLKAMHGGCSIPLGVYSQVQDDSIILDAMISDVEGKRYIRRLRTASVGRAKTCAEELAQQLLDDGGQEILDEIRSSRNDKIGR